MTAHNTHITLKPVSDPYLTDLLDEVSDRYFENTLTASIAWRAPPQTGMRYSVIADSEIEVPPSTFDVKNETIYIHPFLRNSKTPKFVLMYLMYHEGLHNLQTHPKDGNCHDDDFKRKEVLYPKRGKAIAWLKKKGFPVVDW